MGKFKAIITSLSDPNKYWVAFKDTYEDAENWINLQVLRPNRNILQQWFKESLLTNNQISTAIDSRFVEYEEDNYYKEYLIPPEAEFSIQDISENELRKENKEQKKEIGRVLQELSQNILGIIAGHLYSANLTEEEYFQLKSDFADTYQALTENRPLTAKSYIDQIAPTGLVTQDILDDVFLEYEEYKEKYPLIVIY